MAFGFSADEQRKWLADNQERVQDKFSEPVQSWATFQRAGGMAGVGLGQLSGLASLMMSASGKKKAGGLPSNFLLVLTPTKLHAMGFKFRGRGIKVGDELAVWERARINVSVVDKSVTRRLVIESPAEGERVECEGTKSAVIDDFLATLTGEHAAA